MTPEHMPRSAIVLMLIAAFVILFPPLHWLFGQGSFVFSVGYMVGSSLITTVIVFLLSGLTKGDMK